MHWALCIGDVWVFGGIFFVQEAQPTHPPYRLAIAQPSPKITRTGDREPFPPPALGLIGCPHASHALAVHRVGIVGLAPTRGGKKKFFFFLFRGTPPP